MMRCVFLMITEYVGFGMVMIGFLGFGYIPHSLLYNVELALDSMIK